ncbi:hypothetical protein, partial [Trichloromonas sp.]|uniref:hypothetical protein n=1 Tax=Trichloromonas sp. TaxID=3069249 RepID=UPI003D814735
MYKTFLLATATLLFVTLALPATVLASAAPSAAPKSVQPKSYANAQNISQCLVCHGQLDYLRSVVSDTKDGYGHDVSAETVAQGLHVGQHFVNDRIHGRASCEFCHAGDPKATDAKKAHEGLIKDPTA